MEPSTSGQGSSNVQVQLKCKVCVKDFSAEVQPRILPCLHTACAQCLANVTNNTAVASGQQGGLAGAAVAKCPICKEDIRNLEDIVEDTWTVPMVTSQMTQGEMLCTNCDDNVPATNFCVDCQGGLCDPCVMLHRKVKILKDHVIQPKSDEQSASQRENPRPQPPFCSIHPKERLQLYCQKCLRLTCRDCQLMSHKEHPYQFISEAASAQRDLLKQDLFSLAEKEKNAKLMKNNISMIYHKIKNQENGLLCRIDELFNRIRSVLDGQAAALKTRVQEETELKCRILKQQSREVATIESALMQCFSVIQGVLLSDNDVAALQQNRLIKKRMKIVLQTLLTRQPVKELILQFQANNVPSMDALKSIGSIKGFERSLSSNASAAAAAAAAAVSQQQQQVRPGQQGFVQGGRVVSGVNPAMVARPGLQQQGLQPGLQQGIHQGLYATQRAVQDGLQFAQQRINRNMVNAPLVHLPTRQQQVRGAPPHMQANILPVLGNQQSVMGIPSSAPQQQATSILLQPHSSMAVPGPPNVTVTNSTLTFGDLTNAQMLLQRSKHVSPQQNTPARNAQPSTTVAPRSTTTSGTPSPSSGPTTRNTNSASPSSAIAPIDDNEGPRIVSVKSESRTSKDESERPSCRFHTQTSSGSSNGGGGGLQDNQPSSSGLEMQSGSEKTSPVPDVQPGSEIEKVVSQLNSSLTPPLSKSPATCETVGVVVPVAISASDLIGDPDLHIPSIATEMEPSAEDVDGEGAAVNMEEVEDEGAEPETKPETADVPAPSGDEEKEGGGREVAAMTSKEGGGDEAVAVKHNEMQAFLNEMDERINKASTEAVSPFWKGNISWEERDESGKPKKQTIVASFYRINSKKFTREAWPGSMQIKMMNFNILKSLLPLLKEHQLFFVKPEQECKDLYRKLVVIFKKKDVFGAIRLFITPETIHLLFYSYTHQKFYIIAPCQKAEFSEGFVKNMNKYFKMHKTQAKTVGRVSNQNTPTVSESDGDSSDATSSTSRKRPAEDDDNGSKSDPDNGTTEAAEEAGGEEGGEAAAPLAEGEGESSEELTLWKYGFKLRNETPCSRPEDPNDDWCAVCNNGGNLLCCDRCPRVYHSDCHVPVIEDVPEEDFFCTLCLDLDSEEALNDENIEKPEGFTAKEYRLCQRLLLEMHCLIVSGPFWEPVGPEVEDYHVIIPIPMDLSTIKGKLSMGHPDIYSSPRQMVEDLRVMFTNCYTYNGETSDLGKTAQVLQRYASRFVKHHLPDYIEGQIASSVVQKSEERPPKRRKQEHPTSIIHIK